MKEYQKIVQEKNLLLIIVIKIFEGKEQGKKALKM
jgi:hypothetical protein